MGAGADRGTIAIAVVRKHPESTGDYVDTAAYEDIDVVFGARILFADSQLVVVGDRHSVVVGSISPVVAGDIQSPEVADGMVAIREHDSTTVMPPRRLRQCQDRNLLVPPLYDI